jgi:hypothetical protein
MSAEAEIGWGRVVTTVLVGLLAAGRRERKKGKVVMRLRNRPEVKILKF